MKKYLKGAILMMAMMFAVLFSAKEAEAYAINVSYTNAATNTAQLTWNAYTGATGYYIVKDGSYSYNSSRGGYTCSGTVQKVSGGNVLSAWVPITDRSSHTYRVYPVKYYNGADKLMLSSQYSVTPEYGIVYDVRALSTKIATKNFGLSAAYCSINSFWFGANCQGNGWELEGVTTTGKKYKFSGEATYNGGEVNIAKKLKYSKAYKYHVRAYVKLSNGTKKYGSWSDYRVLVNPKDVKYTRTNDGIKIKWGKLTGVSKIKVQVSTKKDKGFKTVKTVKGSAREVSVNSIKGKKFVSGKRYYFRLVYYTKAGKVKACDVVSKGDFIPRWY